MTRKGHHSSAEKVPPPIKGIEGCPARTVRHPKVIKQGCPSRTWAHQEVNITYPTRPWPLYSPPHQVLSLGLQDLTSILHASTFTVHSSLQISGRRRRGRQPRVPAPYSPRAVTALLVTAYWHSHTN